MRRYKWHSSQLAFERYIRAMNEYSGIRKEDNIDMTGIYDNPKFVHRFISSKFQLKGC